MSALVTAQDLVQLLDSPTPPVVLDVRWTLTGPPGREAYDAGHLPNARYVDLDTELADPTHTTGGGRHPLPNPDTFAAAMRRAGVNADSDVVVYGAPDGFGAARAWWCLRYFGHQSVRVLDGGYAAWVEAGLPVETAQPRPAPGDFVARPGGMPRLEADQAARIARDGVLLDARAGERYRGEVEPMDPVAGHIPGAHNLPTAANLDENGRFRPAAELRDRFAAAGVDGGQELGAYCGSGVSAAQEVLALQLAGIPAALYVGSWSDWVSDRERPVATGPDRG